MTQLVCSTGGQTGEQRQSTDVEEAWSWTRLNVVDRRAVDTIDTIDTVDTDAVKKMTQSVSERCRQDMGETV